MVRRAASTSVGKETAEQLNKGLGFKTMRDGVKEMTAETILTPRL